MLPQIKTESRSALIRAMYGRTAARNARKASRSGEIKRILVIRPDHLGDLLFATPALRALRATFPRAHITGAVGPWGRSMWEGNRYLDEIITVRFPGISFRSEGGLLGSYRLIGKVARKVAAGRYDLGVALRFDHWWGAAMMWEAGVSRRWGYDVPGTSTWLTNRVPYQAGRHEVVQNMGLTEAVILGTSPESSTDITVDREKGQPPLLPPAPVKVENDTVDRWLAEPRRAIIHPGTGAANKLWTIQGWVDVIDRLTSEGRSVGLTGSPTEKVLCEAIAASATSGVHNLAGTTANLGQLGWIFMQAGMVLGVDSGPLHIASSLDRPTLHLYGPSDETIWGPWGDPQLHRAFRAPGTHPAMLDVLSRELEGGPEMRAITPEMVLEQVRELERAAIGC